MPGEGVAVRLPLQAEPKAEEKGPIVFQTATLPEAVRSNFNVCSET